MLGGGETWVEEPGLHFLSFDDGLTGEVDRDGSRGGEARVSTRGEPAVQLVTTLAKGLPIKAEPWGSSSSSSVVSGGGTTLLAGPPNRLRPPKRRPVDTAVEDSVRSVMPGVTNGRELEELSDSRFTEEEEVVGTSVGRIVAVCG